MTLMKGTFLSNFRSPIYNKRAAENCSIFKHEFAKIYPTNFSDNKSFWISAHCQMAHCLLWKTNIFALFELKIENFRFTIFINFTQTQPHTPYKLSMSIHILYHPYTIYTRFRWQPFDTNPSVPFDCIQSNKTDMNQTNRLDSRRQPTQSTIKSIIKSNIRREIYVP